MIISIPFTTYTWMDARLATAAARDMFDRNMDAFLRQPTTPLEIDTQVVHRTGPAITGWTLQIDNED